MNFETISLQELYERMEEENTTVLDVRTKEEFESGHVPLALNIPVQELEERLDELSKDQTYLVICRSGMRSQTASAILVENGFSKSFNCEEGMMTWPYEVAF